MGKDQHLGELQFDPASHHVPFVRHGFGAFSTGFYTTYGTYGVFGVGERGGWATARPEPTAMDGYDREKRMHLQVADQ